jgi:hypothetical protein
MFPSNFFDLVLDGKLRVRQLSSTVPLRRLRRQTEFGSAEWYRRFFIRHGWLAVVQYVYVLCECLSCSWLCWVQVRRVCMSNPRFLFLVPRSSAFP